MDIFQKPDVIFFRIKTGSEPARNIYFSGVLRSAIYRRGIFSENIRFRRIFARKISVSHQFDVKNIGFVWWKISVFVQNFFKITTFRNGYFSPFIGTMPSCRACDNKVSHFCSSTKNSTIHMQSAWNGAVYLLLHFSDHTTVRPMISPTNIDPILKD